MPQSWEAKKLRLTAYGACPCGNPVLRTSKRGKDRRLYCSKGCGVTAAFLVKRETKALYRMAGAPMPYPLHVRREVLALNRMGNRPAPSARVIPVRCICKVCGDQLIRRARIGNTICYSCKRGMDKVRPSNIAARFKAKALRRARSEIDADIVNRYEVLCRDKWTCQICGVPTPRELRGTYEGNAPEVDHIIPLAKGGAHKLNNLQCACRRCNLQKGSGGSI